MSFDYPKLCREAAVEFRAAIETLPAEALPVRMSFRTIAQDYDTLAGVIEDLQSKLQAAAKNDEERVAKWATTVAKITEERDTALSRLEALIKEVRGYLEGVSDRAALAWAMRHYSDETCGHYLAKPFPCIKPKGHADEHESSVGQRWPAVENRDEAGLTYSDYERATIEPLRCINWPCALPQGHSGPCSTSVVERQNTIGEPK